MRVNMPAPDAKVVSLAEKREARGSQVYSCGKCQWQGAVLLGDHSIRCGRNEPGICGAQYAADWYEPTGKKLLRKTTRPKTITSPDGVTQHRCGLCNHPFFHVQADGALSCCRTQCRKIALFRWRWHKDTSKAQRHK